MGYTGRPISRPSGGVRCKGFFVVNTMDLAEAFNYPPALETFRENHQRGV